ncbi:MAG: type I restriction enzyme HsdR N-terminal domain-containing protein [Bacteroidales bacterium]|nr:type I restriction enzyme HsdR N-terminal domain-containing protein [Bacteroidales bacterium]
MTTKQTIWDPLRKKEVALTPEEKVRQWCIGVLSGQLGVPMHMMMSEAGFRLGGKQFRSDILVYDRQARPLAVVECKRPEVVLNQVVLDQAIRYNMVLDVKYMIITNGTSTYICRRTETDGQRKYVFMDKVPTYNEMLCQQ